MYLDRTVWAGYVCVCIYHSPNAIVALSKNCPFETNSMIELKNVNNTSYNNVIYYVAGYVSTNKCGDIVRYIVTLLSSVVVLTPNGSFWIVLLLHSVSSIYIYMCVCMKLNCGLQISKSNNK